MSYARDPLDTDFGPEDFVPNLTTTTVLDLIQSCLNAGSIDTLANTPDYELAQRINGAPALAELERRSEELDRLNKLDRTLQRIAWDMGYEAGREYENHNVQYDNGYEFEPVVEPDNPYEEEQ